MRIFHHHRRLLTPTEQYDASTGYAQGLGVIQKTRVVMERDKPDPAAGQVSDTHDRCVLREATFANGLVLQAEPQKRRLTVLQDGKKIARFDDTEMFLPKDPKAAVPPPGCDEDAADCVVVKNNGLTEYIDGQGAIEFEVSTSGGGPTSTYLARPDGTVVGDQADSVPGDGYSDDDAAAHGAKGYYSDDVGNHYYIHGASGTIDANGLVDVSQAPHPLRLTAFVSPQELGNPQPAKPPAFHCDDWYARYDFGANGALTMSSKGANLLGMYDPLAGQPQPAPEEPPKDPAQGVVDVLDVDQCKSLIAKLQEKVAQAERPAGTVERTDNDTVKVDGVELPVRQ